MSVRQLVVVSALAMTGVALQTVPAHADVTNLYVTTTGDDSHDCTTVETACATVNAATFKADPTGTTIHVGAGTFDGPVRPGVFNRSVTIAGAGADQTTLTASETSMGYDGTVVELYGTTVDTLSDLTVSGGAAGGIAVIDPNVVLHLDHVVATGGGCDLYVNGGQVDVTASTFADGGAFGGCGTPPHTHSAGIAVDAGTVTVTGSQLPVSVTAASGLVVNGGSATVDQSWFDGSSNQSDGNQTRGVLATAGTATVTRSTFSGFDTGVLNSGGSASLSDDTFAGNVEGVTGGTGPTTVLRSTFTDQLGAVYGPGPEPVQVAGSVFAGPADTTFGKNCVGAVTDLGYNLSADDSCTFSESTSHGSVAHLDVDTTVADHGGPTTLPTVATFWPSPAVDSIPSGATYGPSSAPLCADTDLRGVPRPQAGACDAGSMELVATTTTLQAPATATPHADVALDATVAVPDVGVAGLGLPSGTVTFTDGPTALCQDVPVTAGHAGCTTSALAAGSHTLHATFTPMVPATSTLHDSTVSRTIKVGTTPAFTSKSKATFTVGKSQTFTVRASGSPSPRITLVKGKLPAGLSLRAGSGSARISGRAKASGVGSHTVTVQATNLRGTVRQRLIVVVKR